MPSIHDFKPEPIEGTRAYLVMEINEGDDDLYVHGCVYDGHPQPLQTPEGVHQDTTPTKVRAWARDYAEQFLPERCIECNGDGVLLDQTYGYANIPDGWTTVQCCDMCSKSSSDEAAARTAAKTYNAKFAYFPGNGDEPGDWAINTVLMDDPAI